MAHLLAALLSVFMAATPAHAEEETKEYGSEDFTYLTGTILEPLRQVLSPEWGTGTPELLRIINLVSLLPKEALAKPQLSHLPSLVCLKLGKFEQQLESKYIWDAIGGGNWKTMSEGSREQARKHGFTGSGSPAQEKAPAAVLQNHLSRMMGSVRLATTYCGEALGSKEALTPGDGAALWEVHREVGIQMSALASAIEPTAKGDLYLHVDIRKSFGVSYEEGLKRGSALRTEMLSKLNPAEP